MNIHVLKGCAPAPLASYLKALGVLRLVSEQADKQARGWWDGEYFCLLTKLLEEELEAFFLEKYEPTPLLSPWNKGCGFFKEDDPGLCPLEKSTAPRFKRFRDGVVAARQLLNEISQADAAIRAIKARTKTNEGGFQTDGQRQLLKQSAAYIACIEQLRTQLAKPDLADDEKKTLSEDIATTEFMISDPTSEETDGLKAKDRTAAKIKLKAKVELLKKSSGYKRLLAAADRRFKSLKATLIPDCRRLWRGLHAEWLSAAVVLDEEGNPVWPSLLGTGGNDGNLDFTNNFMQQLGVLFDVSSEVGGPKLIASELLDNALWTQPANKLTSAAVGQYQPGSAGGANSSTGFASGNLVNPWDFILMMEGSLLFTSRATKRLDPNALSRASAPFAVRPHAAGFATPGAEKAQRGEQWMPLWKQPATLHEVATMYGEARVQLERQTANRPVDVARAISRLGVARGIEAFVRYGYLERNGQSTLAVPLGRVNVPKQQNPRAYLIDDLAGWMDRVQRRSRDRNAPARLIHAERRLADAVFAALTHDYTPARWQAILLAAADIEALQAMGTALEAGPIPALRPDWVAAVADGSAEVRLALALGSAAATYFKGKPFDPVRHHWLPLEPGARRFKTADKRLVNDSRVVLSGRDSIRDLSAIVERRLIEAEMEGQRRSRLVAAPGCGPRLDDIARFLGGNVDLDKLLGLARAFMAIRWNEWNIDLYPKPQKPDDMTEDVWKVQIREAPEECWLAVRLACLPWSLNGDKDIPADAQMVRLLLSGNAARAVEIARSRLRSVGIRPPMQAGVTDAPSARLWAAALAFPIDRRTAFNCMIRLDPRLDPKKGMQHAFY